MPRRRALLRGGTLVLTAATLDATALADPPPDPLLRFGIVTDLHHADKPARGSRFYRQTLAKLEEAGERFQQSGVDFVVELGDLIDAADSVDVEQRYLKTINREFSAIHQDRHYVLGNHCVDTLTKDEFLGGIERRRAHDAFTRNGVRFITLDSCFRSDGTPYGRKNFQWTDPNIPADQLQWLRGQLQRDDAPVIVFAHQRLDVSNHYGVNNAPQVRELLEQSGKVLAVFQGHSHKNDLRQINGIPYCTLVAMVEGAGPENNGYALASLSADGTVHVEGFRRQQDYRWG